MTDQHPPNQNFNFQGNSAVTLNKKTSGLAISSLILGVLSVPLVFLCVGWITGIIGGILGIVAFFSIIKSDGRIGGKWMAATGTLLSLGSIAAFVAMIVTSYNAGKQQSEQPLSAAAAAMKAAESDIATSNGGVTYGNSSQAIELAKQYSELLTELNSTFFTQEGKSGMSISGGKFLVHCHLSTGRCAFLVHVPKYRKYTDDAKQSLEELAWTAAYRVATSNPDLVPSGSALGVGLKGVVLYGAVLTGNVDPDTAPDDAISYSGTSEKYLERFYEPNDDEVFDMPGEAVLMEEASMSAEDTADSTDQN